MYNNIPQNYGNVKRVNRPRPNNYSNNDRFFGGGFAVPFVLGGITGSLLTPRYNYPVYYPYPYYQNYRPYPYYPYRPY